MAQSYTKNAEVPRLSEVRFLANAAHQYVKKWAQAETKTMLRDTLCIIPMHGGFQVGRYTVKQENKSWNVYNYFNELVEAFTCKQSAVSYCVLLQLDMINFAAELRTNDTKLGRLTQDNVYYERQRNRAIKKKDPFTIDLSDARIAETTSKIALAREELEKTLEKAKYIKGIWD